MRFIADAMLGRLAKWLRLFGFDVLYYPAIEDRQVIKIGLTEERTILTRDARMLQCKAVKNAVFIRSDHVFEQLLEIKDLLDFQDPDILKRCIVCNGSLYPAASREQVKDLVPDYVYHNFENFMCCSDCGKVYWEGSHYKKIRERLRQVLRGNNED